MSIRHLAAICATGSLAALSLTLAAPAAAQDLPPIAPPAPMATDMRPAWYGGAQLDPRARDAWLGECRRRTAFYYHGGMRHHRGRHGHGDDHAGHAPGYDYCEAYLDDYYRYYSQGGVSYGYGSAPHAMQPMMVPSQVQREVPTEEVVTEEYVPLRSRSIPRRPVHSHDKRVRVN